MNSEYNSIENQKRAEEEKKKKEDELFSKYCPEPDWLNEDELTEKEKEILNSGKKLIREKFVANVISGKIELQDEEKSIFDSWQENEKHNEHVEQEETKQETIKKSWYEKMMEEKIPCFITTKIPKNTEYKGIKQKDPGYGAESANKWYINCQETSQTRELSKSFEFRKAEKGSLIVAKKGEYLIIEFCKIYSLDKERYAEKRTGWAQIAYQPSAELLKNIWDDLKKDSSKENIFSLIDPKLKELIFSERDISNIKIVIEEQK